MGKTALFLLCMFFLTGCHRFPDNADVGVFFVNLQKNQSTRESYEVTKRFLASIRDPGSISEDRVVELFLKRLAVHYLKSEDADILRAVDDTPVDGGFANFVCDFYKTVIKSPSALQHYQNNCKGLRRCIGISLSPEEATNICNGKGTEKSAQHGGPPDRR